MTSQPPEVSLRTRWLIYAGAWVTAWFGCTALPLILEGKSFDPNWMLFFLLFFYLFPIGLPGLHDAAKGGNTSWISANLYFIVILVWGAYFVHGVLTLRSQTRLRFFLLLAILAVVLTINVRGCMPEVVEFSHKRV